MKKLTILALLVVIPFLNLNSQWIIKNDVSTGALYGIHFANTQTGWVAGEGSTIFKTTNSGASWNPQTTGMPAAGYFKKLFFLNTSFGWGVGYNNSPLTGYVFKTNNGGTIWTQFVNPSIAQNHSFYDCYSYDSSVLILAGSYSNTLGAIWKTTNGGNIWYYPVSGQYGPLRCFYFLNTMTGWAGGSNSLWKTTNGGNNWTFRNYSGTLVSLHFVDTTTGWAGTDDGRLLKTTNGGTNYFTYLTGPAFTSLNSIKFPNTSTGYCANGSLVFKTTNTGINWIPMETGVPSDIEAMHCPSVNYCYASTFDGQVVYTSNGGGNYPVNTITFRKINLNKPIIMNGTTYDTITAYIPTPNSLVLDVNVLIDTVINNIDSNLTFILSHQGVSDTVIYRAGGSGNNFIRTVLNDSATVSINAGIPPFTGSYKPSKPLSKFNYLPLNGQWILRIKESQTGIRTGVIKSWGITISYNAPISVKKISEIVPTNFELGQNYPNPFNPKTILRFKVKDSRFVTLKIFDILGKEIATLVNGKQTPGVYEVAFDGSKLTSGVYFYRLIAGDFSETKKMILIK